MRRFALAILLCGCEGGLDALVAGNGTTDGGALTDAPAPTTCQGNFCDDFEKEPLGPPRWTIEDDTGRGLVTIAANEGRRGTRGLRTSTPMTGESGASVQHLLGGVRTSGLVAVRAWFALAGPVPANASLVELRRAGRARGGVSLKLFADKLGYDVSDATGVSRATGAPAASSLGATFVCIRLYVDVGTTGRIRVLRGEETVIDVPTDTLVGTAGWEAISIGLPFVSSTPGATALVDDVVIADQPIGCE